MDVQDSEIFIYISDTWKTLNRICVHAVMFYHPYAYMEMLIIQFTNFK